MFWSGRSGPFMMIRIVLLVVLLAIAFSSHGGDRALTLVRTGLIVVVVGGALFFSYRRRSQTQSGSGRPGGQRGFGGYPPPGSEGGYGASGTGVQSPPVVAPQPVQPSAPGESAGFDLPPPVVVPKPAPPPPVETPRFDLPPPGSTPAPHEVD